MHVGTAIEAASSQWSRRPFRLIRRSVLLLVMLLNVYGKGPQHSDVYGFCTTQIHVGCCETERLPILCSCIALTVMQLRIIVNFPGRRLDGEWLSAFAAVMLVTPRDARTTRPGFEGVVFSTFRDKYFMPGRA